MQKPINFDEIWLEVRGKEEVIQAELIGGNRSVAFLLVSLNLKLSSGAIIHPDLYDYGSRWRAWAHKPTDEERSAAEWKGLNNGHEFCFKDDICPHKKPDDCMKCELYCTTPVWMRYRNPETDAKPQFRKFQGTVTLHYQPEFAIEEPDFGKDPLKEAARAMREQLVKAVDKLDQKIVDACIQAAREEGVCLTLLDKKFLVDAIKEKMEREGLMNEATVGAD